MPKTASRRAVQITAAILIFAAPAAHTQQSPPGSAPTAPDVGQMAPDFTLPGATQYGLLRDPVRLSDYRGQTVVLAFFAKARTKG